MFWPKQFPGCVSLWLLLLCLLQRKYSQSISNVFQSTRLCLPKDRFDDKLSKKKLQPNRSHYLIGSKAHTRLECVLRPGPDQTRVRPGHQSAFSVSSYIAGLCVKVVHPSTSLLRIRSPHCALFVRSSTRARLLDPLLVLFRIIPFYL